MRPHHLTERETRLLYIDVFLEEAGWEVMTDKGGIHYGKCLERQYGVKPVLYYTNGHDIWVDDRIYPERPDMVTPDEVFRAVYFRKVRSKIKFFQMLGRGTRPCPDVFSPGCDKERFFVFDYCGNFDYFIGEGGQGTDELGATVSQSQRVFVQRVRLMLALQDVRHQAVESRRAYWKELHDIVAGQIRCGIRTWF